MAAVKIEELRLQIAERLPVLRRWSVGGVAWDWDFRRAQEPLHPLDDDDVHSWGEVPPVDWPRYLVFGVESHDGGASPFTTVHSETGVVFGLDIECDGDAAYLLNSSVDRFIETFLTFDAVLRGGADPAGLLARVQQIDPEIFLQSEWRHAAEHVEETMSAAE